MCAQTTHNDMHQRAWPPHHALPRPTLDRQEPQPAAGRARRRSWRPARLAHKGAAEHVAHGRAQLRVVADQLQRERGAPAAQPRRGRPDRRRRLAARHLWRRVGSGLMQCGAVSSESMDQMERSILCSFAQVQLLAQQSCAQGMRRSMH